MPTVFIVCDYGILASGLASLISGQTDLEVVGCETNPESALERIQRLRPEVIVVSSERPLGEPLPTMLRLLQSEPGVSVIGLNLEDNTICICPGQRHLLAGPQGLLEAIRQYGWPPQGSGSPATGSASPPHCG